MAVRDHSAPGVDRQPKTMEEIYEEINEQKESKRGAGISGVVSRVANTGLNMVMRYGMHGMSAVAGAANEASKSMTYVPDNLSSVREQADQIAASGKKVKTLGYTDAQIDNMSDLDKQKVITAGFATNPNGEAVQRYMEKASAYDITAREPVATEVIKPRVTKSKALPERQQSVYMGREDYDIGYGTPSHLYGYDTPEETAPVEEGQIDSVFDEDTIASAEAIESGVTEDRQMEKTMHDPEKTPLDREAMLKSMEDFTKGLQKEPELDMPGSRYF